MHETKYLSVYYYVFYMTWQGKNRRIKTIAVFEKLSNQSIEKKLSLCPNRAVSIKQNNNRSSHYIFFIQLRKIKIGVLRKNSKQQLIT